MNNFFLRLYVAAQNHKAAAREDGFVTAEHLAIAVVGIVLVGGVYTMFNQSIKDNLGGFLDDIWKP